MLKLVKSVIKSSSKGVYNDPEMQKFFKKHPHIFHFVKKRLSPDEKFGLYLTVGTIATSIFIFFFFSIIQDLINQDSLIQSDLRLINLVQIFRTPVFNNLMLFITYLGKWQIVFFGVIVIGAIFLIFRKGHYLTVLIISVLGGEVFVWIVKNLIERPRPPLINALAPEKSFSFPSGHSFIAFSFYGLLTYFLFRKARGKVLKTLSIVSGAIIIIAIGFSRIYLGAHWPSDVLASFVSGAAWLSVLITALEIRRKFNFMKGGTPVFKKPFILSIVLVLLWFFYMNYFFHSHPLKPYRTPVPENRIVISKEDIPQSLFVNLPRYSESIKGENMEPINIIIVAKESELKRVFEEANWFLTDPITFRSVYRLISASIFDAPYPTAPGAPSFWNTRPNDFAFEKSTPSNSVREREHIHFWKTSFIVDDEKSGQRVWFGTAHFDKSIKMGPTMFFPTHSIDPAVDKERGRVKEDLVRTGDANLVKVFQIVEPSLGKNQGGDQFFTDGKAYIIFLNN